MFPDNLKISIVKPIFIKGISTEPNNYRSIALIPVLAKIFENVMFARLYNFLIKFNILNPNQHGFQRAKSTTLATFKLVHKLIENIDKK